MFIENTNFMNIPMIINMPENELVNFSGLSVPVNKNYENELQDFYEYLISILNTSNSVSNTPIETLKAPEPILSRQASQVTSKTKDNINQSTDAPTGNGIAIAMQQRFFIVKEMDNLSIDKLKIMSNGYMYNNKKEYNFMNLSKDDFSVISEVETDKESDINKAKLVEKEFVKIGFISKAGDPDFFKSLSALKDEKNIIDDSKIDFPITFKSSEFEVGKELKSINSDFKDLSTTSENLDTTNFLKINDNKSEVVIKDNILKEGRHTVKDLDDIFHLKEDLRVDKSTSKEILNKYFTLSENKDSLEVKIKPIIYDEDILEGDASENKELVSNYVLKNNEKQTDKEVKITFKETFLNKDIKELSGNLYRKEDKKSDNFIEDIKNQNNFNTVATADGDKIKNIKKDVLEMKNPIKGLNLFEEISETKDIHILNKDKASLEVRVEPEGLGKLDIKLILDNDSINAKIVAFDKNSKEVIEGNILNIIDSLTKEGLNVSGFSVSLRQRKEEPNYFKESGDKKDLVINEKDFVKKHTQEGVVSIFI